MTKTTNGVEISDDAAAALINTTEKYRIAITTGDHSLDGSKMGIRYPSNTYFADNRRKRGAVLLETNGDDARPMGVADLMAQELGMWRGIAIWYGQFIDDVEKKTEETGQQKGLGDNPWETWASIFGESTWKTPGNALPYSDNSWGDAGAPSPAKRIWELFHDAVPPVEPQSAEVAEMISQTAEFYEKQWDNLNADMKTLQQKWTTDFEAINGGENVNLSSKENWWEFDDIYFLGPGPGLMTPEVAWDSTKLSTGKQPTAEDFDPNVENLLENKDVLRGPPHNLPILYGMDGARTVTSHWQNIRSTSNWSNARDPSGAKAGFKSMRFLRGFLRGPYGASVETATYEDNTKVVAGSHILYFHYNPASIDLQLTMASDVFGEDQMDSSQAVGSVKGYVLSYNLMFDRHQEMYQGTLVNDIEGLTGYSGAPPGMQTQMSLDDAYAEALAAAHNFSNEEGFDIAPAGESVGAGYGVLKDIAVLRSVLMMSASGRGAGGRVVCYFGPGMIIHAMPVNAGVQYTHFSRHMIPTRCIISMTLETISPATMNADGGDGVPEGFDPPPAPGEDPDGGQQGDADNNPTYPPTPPGHEGGPPV